MEIDTVAVPGKTGGLPWVEKYRPKQHSDFISHEEIIQTIEKIIENNQIPHHLL